MRPRPVYCVTEHLRRDRQVADEACEGRFTELGMTLALGVPPDWTGGAFPADEEWRIAWAKFYFGLDLAAAFRETGDERYQRTWELLVDSWIEQVPVGSESTDTVARRLLNWVYAWNAFARGASASRASATAWRRACSNSMAAQVTWLRDNLTPRRNHRTLELYALFVVALALPGLDKSGELLDFALAELERNLSSDFRPDGVHVESSTHYHLIVLRSLVGVRENARRFGLDASARLRRAPVAGARLRDALPPTQTARSRHCRTATPGPTRSCSRSRPISWRAPTCSTRRPAERAARRRALETSASLTAATTSSAAGGEKAPTGSRTSAS